MCVDTRKNSLGNFGLYLPNLIQLKLNPTKVPNATCRCCGWLAVA